MKINDKEINVFSMSALDLFASGMGAFILIMVVLLPYFPNTSTAVESEPCEDCSETEQQLEQSVAELEKTRQALAEAEEKIAGLVPPSPPCPVCNESVALPAMDLIVAVDSTGSMTDQIEGLKGEIAQIARVFDALSPSFAMGLIDFKDICESPSIRLRSLPLVEVGGGGIAQLRRFANSIEAGSTGCNEDVEEHLAGALQAGIETRWRDVSEARIIVIVSDNGPYQREITRVLAAARQFAGLREKNRISTMFVNTGDNALGEEFLRTLADAGNGQFVRAGGSLGLSILEAMAGL